MTKSVDSFPWEYQGNEDFQKSYMNTAHIHSPFELCAKNPRAFVAAKQNNYNLIYTVTKEIRDLYDNFHRVQNFIICYGISSSKEFKKNYPAIYNAASGYTDYLKYSPEEYITLVDAQRFIYSLDIKHKRDLFLIDNFRSYGEYFEMMGFLNKLRFTGEPESYSAEDIRDFVFYAENSEKQAHTPDKFKEHYPELYKKALDLDILLKIKFPNSMDMEFDVLQRYIDLTGFTTEVFAKTNSPLYNYSLKKKIKCKKKKLTFFKALMFRDRAGEDSEKNKVHIENYIKRNDIWSLFDLRNNKEYYKLVKGLTDDTTGKKLIDTIGFKVKTIKSMMEYNFRKQFPEEKYPYIRMNISVDWLKTSDGKNLKPDVIINAGGEKLVIEFQGVQHFSRDKIYNDIDKIKYDILKSQDFEVLYFVDKKSDDYKGIIELNPNVFNKDSYIDGTTIITDWNILFEIVNRCIKRIEKHA